MTMLGTFGGCRILQECGSGAYGTVYLAEDALGRRVALKVFNSQWNMAKRTDSLRRYMNKSAGVPGLVSIFHFGIEDGHFFYVMEAADSVNPEGKEYVPDTLDRRLREGRRLPLEDSLSICYSILEALEALHHMGMVHRDLKPENVLFIQGRPKLGDLDFIDDFSHSLSIAGTLGFIPPEYLANPELPKNPGNDLYALGKIFYCSVTGNNAAQYPRLPHDLPVSVMSRICVPLTRLCSRTPSTRPKDCRDFRKVLPRTPVSFSYFRRRLSVLQMKSWYPWVVRGTVVLGVVLCVLCGMAFQSFRQRVLEERAAVMNSLLKDVQEYAALTPFVESDLSPERRKVWHEVLTRCQALREWSGRGELEAGLAELDGVLKQEASEKMPVALKDTAFTHENILANGWGFGFLHSPLARRALPREQWNALRQRMLDEAAAMYPKRESSPVAGKGFALVMDAHASFDFVPPGGNVSYPFWIMNQDVTNWLFFMFCRYSRNLAEEGNKTPVHYLSANDILVYSLNMETWLEKYAMLPPGYMLRPATREEMVQYQRMSACGGLAYDLKLEEPVYHKPTQICMDAQAPYALWRQNENARNGEWMSVYRDVMTDDGYTLRLVVAPGDKEQFYRQAYMRSKPLTTLEEDGRRYVCSNLCAAGMTFEAATQWAADTHARVCEPMSFQHWQHLYRSLKNSGEFPAVLGITWQQDGWRTLSDGTKLDWKELPGKTDTPSLTLYGTDTKLGLAHNTRLPIVIWQWNTEDAWEKRSEAFDNGTAAGIVKKITVGNRQMYVYRLNLVFYGAVPLFELAGYRPAVLHDAGMRGEAMRQLKDFAGVIGIGAYRYYSTWCWLDGKEEPLAIPLDVRTGTMKIYSPAIDCLAFDHGTLKRVPIPEYYLIEKNEN